MSITTQTYPQVSLSFKTRSKTTSNVTPILRTSVTSHSHILIDRSPLNRIVFHSGLMLRASDTFNHRLKLMLLLPSFLLLIVDTSSTTTKSLEMVC